MIRGTFFIFIVVLLTPSSFLYSQEMVSFSDVPVQNDVVLSPARIELEATPGARIERTIKLTNRLGVPANFYISAEDIRGTSDASLPVELLGIDNGKYSLKNYLFSEIRQFRLLHGESINLPIYIQLPPNSPPGGHYGSVVITFDREGEDSDLDGVNTDLRSRLGALLFVRVPGEMNEKGMLEEFNTFPEKKLFFNSFPQFSILFANEGTVHLNPYGVIKIKNIFGMTVEEIPVPPGYVLPESKRTFLLKSEPEYRFGKYSAELTLNLGYDNTLSTLSITFWMLPWTGLVLCLGVLLFMLIILRAVYRRLNLMRRVT